MDKRIVLAAAGAGKTYYIANDFTEDERVILISFTNSNVDNIRKEVKKRFSGVLPDNVQIMTFDSFIYNDLLKPIEPIFLSQNSSGVNVTFTPEEDSRKPGYVKKDDINHYINNSNEYYVNRMGKLFLNYGKERQKLAISRLEKYCDAIYFDEFQDYNGFDFKVFKFFLEKTKLSIVAVGDIHQSCLTPLRNRGNQVAKSPFYTIDSIEDLKEKFSSKIHFDESTLEKSRRVPQRVCDMIQEKLGVSIQSNSENEAAVKYLTDVEDIHKIILNPDIPKLIWDKRSRHPEGKNYVNWTYSKGDTYLQSCIILTSGTSITDNWTNISSLKTRNALYVALTRSKGDVYLITDTDYKKWRSYVNNL